MRRDIARFIASCVTCQYCNRPAVKPSGFLQSLPVTTLFHTIVIDFVWGFASTFLGNKYILVAIDHFSKYVDAAATPNMISATVAVFPRKNWSHLWDPHEITFGPGIIPFVPSSPNIFGTCSN